MDPQQMMAYSLLGLLICNILTLIAIAFAGWQILRVTTAMKEQTQTALQKVQDQVKDTLDHVRPIIDHIQVSTRAMREGVQSAQDTVKEVEHNVSTIATPMTALMVAGRVLGIKGTKFGILGLLTGAFLKARQKTIAKQAPHRSLANLAAAKKKWVKGS